VAGGIRSVEEARVILNSGADKISINSPALENPLIIEKLVHEFGSQCVVVGIDSYGDDQDYWVMQYTGSEKTILNTKRKTSDWVKEVQSRGAGEIVLNCMNQDGVRKGYDLDQLIRINDLCQVPLIASGGAGAPEHFKDVFTKAHVSGALAASVFHSQQIQIPDLKKYLKLNQIEVRL
jgi:cyclase